MRQLVWLPGSRARLAQCSSIHIVGPPSAAGSAFIRSESFRDRYHPGNIRTRNETAEGRPRLHLFQKSVQSTRVKRHRRDGQDESTQSWFGQAGRGRPLCARSGLSAAVSTQVSEAKWKPLTVQSIDLRASAVAIGYRVLSTCLVPMEPRATRE